MNELPAKFTVKKKGGKEEKKSYNNNNQTYVTPQLQISRLLSTTR